MKEFSTISRLLLLAVSFVVSTLLVKPEIHIYGEKNLGTSIEVFIILLIQHFFGARSFSSLFTGNGDLFGSCHVTLIKMNNLLR